VTRGIVLVRDFVRRKTVTLLAGQSYFAKAPPLKAAAGR